MAVKVMIPTPLRSYTNQKDAIEVQAENVHKAIDQLVSMYPDLKKHLLDERGNLRSFVNVYVNDEDIRSLKEIRTKIKDGDVLMIVPSIAGGK